MHRRNWKRLTGNATCLVAFALLTNLLVRPGITHSERHLELNLAVIGAGVGLGLLWLARKHDEFRSSL